MKLIFCGAARCVTGSCHLLSTDSARILIDCGTRQGQDAKGPLGEGDFPFDPRSIDAVVLTHAHIDHSGLIPLLVKRGFTGPVLATEATVELCTVMLPDSASILESDAEYRTRKNRRSGTPPAEPLYTQEDVEKALRLFHGAPYGTPIDLLPGISCLFTDAGHLLGSASVSIRVTERGRTSRVVFSGDLGRADRPILRDPQTVAGAEYLILEGTYGDRDHDVPSGNGARSELASALRQAIALRGNLIIPAFAIGRTQDLLYHIKCLLAEGSVPGLETMPVYVDSPLAIRATSVYEHCAQSCYDEEARSVARNGSPFDFPTLRIARTTEESKALNDDPVPKVILSASGMCDSGRIRHHLKHNLYKPNACVLFAGYQAAGTLGRALTDGAKQVKLLGETVSVQATILRTEGFSGHAGKSELIAWAEAIPDRPKHVFLVHGEDPALESLRSALLDRGFSVSVPQLLEEAELSEKADAGLPCSGEAIPLGDTTAVAACEEQLDRLRAIAQRSLLRRSPDTELKRTILEADLRSLADKWDVLLP